MLVIPDATTAWIDPFNAEPTLSLICTIVDPITREPYDRDPRGVERARGIPARAPASRIRLRSGRRAEFFIFDEVRYHATPAQIRLSTSSIARKAIGNSGKEEFPNLGYKIRAKEGYFPVAPADTQQDIRNEMCLELEKAGIPIERQHHACRLRGQAEIYIRLAPRAQGVYMHTRTNIVCNVAKDADALTRTPPRTMVRACTRTCRFGKKANRSSRATATRA